MLIAPPSLGKKDTILSLAGDLLNAENGFFKYIQNRNIKVMKKLKVVRNEASKQEMVLSVFDL
jgi:hypothetical protein